MSIDNRTRAQWREAFEQCQAHARKMRRELERAESQVWKDVLTCLRESEFHDAANWLEECYGRYDDRAAALSTPPGERT